MLKLNSNTLATWCEQLTYWERPWCWERLRAGEEDGDREWDGWMASPIPWTWVWAKSAGLWRTGKPSMLRSVGSQSRTQPGDWTNNKARKEKLVKETWKCWSLSRVQLLPCRSPGGKTAVGCHALLQGIFPTQGSNMGLLHHMQILYHLSHRGRPEKLVTSYKREWR